MSEPNSYKSLAITMMMQGNYFPFCRAFAHVLPIDVSVVLQSLINLGSNNSKDGWVLCTTSYLRASLGLERDAQIRILNRLKDAGVIEWKQMGNPAKRHIHINEAETEKLLKRGLEESAAVSREREIPLAREREIPLAHGNGISRYYNNKGNYNLSADADGGILKEEGLVEKEATKSSFGHTCALKLYKGLVKARKIMREVSIASWVGHFNRLKQDVMSSSQQGSDSAEEQIEEAIQFHLNHLKDKYQPKLYSAKSFCDNYSKVVDAMARLGERPEYQDEEDVIN